MHQTTFLPSIFDLIPRTDISKPSRNTDSQDPAAFEGILSEKISSGDVVDQSRPREEESSVEEIPKASGPEQSRETNESEAGSDEVQEDTKAEDTEPEASDDSSNEEGEQDEPREEATADEESKETPEENDVTEDEVENTEESQTAEPMEEQAEITKVVEDPEISVMAMMKDPEISVRAMVQPEDNAEQVVGDDENPAVKQPVIIEKAFVEEVAVDRNTEVSEKDVAPTEDVPVEIKSEEAETKPSDIVPVKDFPEQKVEMKSEPKIQTQPEIQTQEEIKKEESPQVEISKPVKDTAEWNPHEILQVHEARVRRTVTNEIRTDSNSQPEEPTQTGLFKEAPMPLIKDAEVQLNLDVGAQASTNPTPTKPVKPVEVFEIVEDTESAKSVDKTNRPTQTTASRPTAGRSLEMERSVATQIVHGTLSTLRSGRNELLLHLRPPELGSVRIRLTLENDVMTARIVVSTETVREMIDRQLDHLRSSLNEEGVKIERFEVLVGEQYDREAARKEASEDNRQEISDEGSIAAESTSTNDEFVDEVRKIYRVKSENSRLHVIA